MRAIVTRWGMHGALLAGLLVLPLRHATAEVDIRVSRLQAAYIQAVGSIEDRYRGYDRERPVRYQASLLHLQKRLQEAGDADGVKAIQAEIERHSRERTVPQSDFTTEPSVLGELQEKFAAAQRRQSLQNSRDIIDMTQKYTERLQALRAELAAAGDTVSAAAVDEEIKKVAGSPHVAAAEFEVRLLGAASTKEPEPSGGSEEEPGEDGASPPGDEPALSFPDITIYKPGAAASRLEKHSPKRTTLSRAERSPAFAPVSASVWQDDRYDSGPFIRLAFRSRSTDTVVPKMHVVLEYFTTPTRVRKVSPRRAAMRYFIVRNIGKDLVYVDCAPVQQSARLDRLALSYWQGSSFKEWSRYYGLIVSLYDHKGEPMYQGVTPQQLKEHARLQLPSQVLAAEARLVEKAGSTAQGAVARELREQERPAEPGMKGRRDEAAGHGDRPR